MKNTKRVLLPLLFLLLCSSCARSYRKLYPENEVYTETQEADRVSFSYRYSILRNKYRNKEGFNNVKLIAVKCTNNSGRDLVFGTDIKLMKDPDKEALLLDNHHIYKKLRQRSASHLWMLLFTFLYVNIASSSGGGTSYGGATAPTNSTFIPIGFLLGPGLTLGNISVASAANKAFRDDLRQYNLLGTTIRKGETVYGLLGVRTYEHKKLSLRVSPVP